MGFHKFKLDTSEDGETLTCEKCGESHFLEFSLSGNLHLSNDAYTGCPK
jgi:hypothetical protein